MSLLRLRTAILLLAAALLVGVAPSARASSASATPCADMSRLGYFEHTTPTGTSFAARVRRAGYTRGDRHVWVGENIAWGAGRGASARAIVGGWMASPPHRANVLAARFREIGIGVAAGAPVRLSGAPSAATVTADFGQRGPRRG